MTPELSYTWKLRVRDRGKLKDTKDSGRVSEENLSTD